MNKITKPKIVTLERSEASYQAQDRHPLEQTSTSPEQLCLNIRERIGLVRFFTAG